ncbi:MULTISPECIES: STM3941 family protein [Pontibacillus]|uniref:STM3941 family protein n=1 Tax=Pontibacillus chungwhensis TaxID=265426 RepID=A0ABY8V3F2_9BACI|nr:MULTISPECIES: STM3941 family protein [Pontibacillus]WIG00159.1 STM3941 family protein [Pontibacillus chungwhensis]
MTFYYSKGKLVSLTVLCFLIGIGCAFVSYFAFTDNELFIGSLVLLASLVLLICGGVYIKKATNTKPYVILTDEQVTLYVTRDEAVHIPYEDIVDVIPYEIHRNRFLGLQLADEERYAKQMPQKVKRLSNMNVKMGYPMYNIMLSQLKDPQGLMEALGTRLERKEMI